MLIQQRNPMQKLLFLLLTFSIAACALGQPKHKKSSSEVSPADKYCEEALIALDEGHKEKALELINKAVKKDSTSGKAWQYKGGIEYEMADYKAALKSYNKLMSLEPEDMSHYFMLGRIQKMLMMFDEAKVSFNKYLNAPIRRSKDYEAEAKAAVTNLEALKALYSHPVDFKPINMGPGINSSNGEYWPGMTLDGRYFYYTRMIFRGDKPPFEDFYRSEAKDSTWLPSIKLPEPINTSGNEGTISISADGKTIFFSSTDRVNSNGVPIGQGSQDIYLCFYNAGTWSNPFNLGPPVSTRDWDAQPSISPDGLDLYFASDRDGGYGKIDIWVTHYSLVEHRWLAPVNLGPDINTSGNDESPFIHYDNQTLYFSSDGLPGVGGMDIFVTHKDESGKFGKPVNVGYPINTEQDEQGLIVDRYGKFGYLSSERPGGYGGLDIYKFALPSTMKPTPMSYVEGVVYDATTMEKLQAMIELTDLETGKVVTNVESQKGTGSFFLMLKSNRNYMLTVDQTNYLFYSANFSLKEHPSLDPYKLEVPLKKPAIDVPVVLNNVFFDVDKYELKPESRYELDKLVHLMKKFPFMKIEISGHTDNTGDKAKNKTLSQNRAKAVKDYLVNAGIEATRMNAVGYGDTQPVAGNDTEEGRAKNRRTMFKVLSVQ